MREASASFPGNWTRGIRHLLKSFRILENAKLTPLSVLIGLGSVLLVAYATLGLSYLQRKSEQPSLEEQIEAGGGTLTGVGDSQQAVRDLEEQLALSKLALAGLQGSFTGEMDSAALVQSIMAYGSENRVQIREMKGLSPRIEQDADGEEGGYVVLSYSLTVDGALPDLLNFLRMIESGSELTAAVDRLSLTPVGSTQTMTAMVSFYARAQGTETALVEGGIGENTPQPPLSLPETPVGGAAQ